MHQNNQIYESNTFEKAFYDLAACHKSSHLCGAITELQRGQTRCRFTVLKQSRSHTVLSLAQPPLKLCSFGVEHMISAQTRWERLPAN